MTGQAYLLDGTYELFRAYYGGPPAQDPAGRDVGATLTLFRSFCSLLGNPKVTHVACAFDHVIESFRNDLFDGYKTGDGIDPSLFAQFPLAERISAALGIVTWPMIEFEADDAVATGADICAADPRISRVFLCSPDKDLAQCVTGDRIVLFDRMRRIVLDEPGVVAKFGVRPLQIADYLALVGDAADGIPGITGWGAKSAAAILAAHGSIDDIPDDVAKWNLTIRRGAALAAELAGHREEARLYRRLATLRRDVPLGVSVDDLEWRGPDYAVLEGLERELGADFLLERARAVVAARASALTDTAQSE